MIKSKYYYQQTHSSNENILNKNKKIKELGIGDWGLGIGDWGLGPIPNPQSPIPNPHLFVFLFIYFLLINYMN